MQIEEDLVAVKRPTIIEPANPWQVRLATAVAAMLVLAACSSSPSATSTPVVTASRSATASPAGSPTSDDPFVPVARAAAEAATAPVTTWDGPTTGPKAQAGKSLVCISQDQQNGGPAGICAGAQEAAQAIGWTFQILDAKGTADGDLSVMNQALALHPDGIVNASISIDIIAAQLRQAADAGIKVVGWHATTFPGSTMDPPEFYNVQSDQVVGGRTMADYVIADSNGKAGVAIVNWSIFPIAILKVDSMKIEIERCRDCKILSEGDIALTDGAQKMPTYVTGLVQQYGSKLTHLMFINDGYADFSIPAYQALGIGPSGPPVMVSFGDGSAPAYQRIRDGQYQTATIPEPLDVSAWQMIDELNRAFAGEPPSGYVQPVHLVVKGNVDADGGTNNIFDPQNHYRDEYKKIWGV
jgi:ribose transport system substrate-binding protein